MSGKTRTSLLSLTIIAVILFSAFGPTIAYADGGTTEDSPPAEATATPEETSVEEASTETTSEGAATEETAEAEPAAETTEPQATEEAVPVVEETTPAAEEPVLTEVPENTSVTVLDANGESQPLATQEAADAIATSDPIWCPEGATPIAGANGCTTSFSSFDELLTTLSGNPDYQGAGTIYVQQGAYTGNDPGGVIDFNSPSYDLSNIRNSNLSVTGGWNPGGAVDPASPSNFTDTRILIGSDASPWGGSVAVNNITMTFSNEAPEAPPAPENALTIYSQGDVSLSNVTISNAPSAGAEIEAGGGVTIKDSKFHRNKTAGTIVRAGGSVTVENGSFSNPLVTRQRRQIVGLDINSGAAVTLANVMAVGNREVGTNIVAGSDVTIGNSVFSGTKEIEGPRNAPTAFLGYGLQVNTPGRIAIDNVTANDNFLWGASLTGGSDIAIRNSVFNANTTESPGFIDDTGLFVNGGSIVTLTNVMASDNRLFGTQIDAVGTVTVSGSTFNNNNGVINTGGANTFHGHGMQINSLADIIVQNTDASGNMLFGGQLNAGGQVVVANSTFNNTTTGTDANAVGQGLEIVSGGNSTLANVVLDNNQTFGAEIQAGGIAWLENVTATDNGTDGVSLQATCTHLIGGTYSGNGQYGLNLGNSALNLLAPPTFSNNGAGAMFPDNPPTCTFSFLTAGATTTAASSNIFASAAPQSDALSLGSETAAAESEAASENVSLNEFLASTKTAHGSIFIGKYAYVDTDSGIQVFALVPSGEVLAKD